MSRSSLSIDRAILRDGCRSGSELDRTQRCPERSASPLFSCSDRLVSLVSLGGRSFHLAATGAALGLGFSERYKSPTFVRFAFLANVGAP